MYLYIQIGYCIMVFGSMSSESYSPEATHTYIVICIYVDIYR